MMPIKIFVGNFSDSFNENKLNDLFSGLPGFIGFSIIRDTYSGRSRGFGFLQIMGNREAEEAVRKLNGYEIEGKKMILNIARNPYQP